MRFSDRYGFRKIDTSLMRKDVPAHLRTRIWNIFYEHVFKNAYLADYKDFTYFSWRNFFKKDLHLLDKFYGSDESSMDLLFSITKSTGGAVIENVKNLFLEIPWYEVYDFVEFFAEHYPKQKERKEILQAVNLALKEERAPYRVIDRLVTPLTSDEEIKELESALNVPDKFSSAKDHLRKALTLLSNRKKPDYANSIKESISALESLVKTLLGEKGTLGELMKKLDIHPALKEGFQRIYGWTSDNGGIRHGKTVEALEPEFAEARYMLITTSAFVNYLIEKFSREEK